MLQRLTHLLPLLALLLLPPAVPAGGEHGAAGEKAHPEGEAHEEEGGGLALDAEARARAGIRVAPAARRALARELAAPGEV
ncbi:MAG TPA: hypothetical protein ENK20_00875, partial [Chromatiales bacterium]|nr:hypothetical protein [Chromatiales bacterium]